jgi:hypothetical protein
LKPRKAGLSHLINADNVHDYAPVGCLENTMVGNDRSGTVDVNLNLLKAVELALTGGKDLIPFLNPMTGREEAITGRTGYGGGHRLPNLGGFLGTLCPTDRIYRSKKR